MQRGEPLLEVDIALHGRRFEASYFAVRDDRGELLAVGKAMIDVTARRRAEEARRRLQEATAALASAVTVADVAAVAIEQAGKALDADAAVLLTARRRAPACCRSSATTISADGARDRWRTVSTCRADAGDRGRAHRAEPSSSPTRPTLLERFPGLAGAPYPRAGAYAALPLVAYGRTLGVLSIGFTAPRRLRRGRARRC